MNHLDEIFEKATIRGITNYLLFGSAPVDDTRDYQTRLNDAYIRYENAVFKREESATTELLDLANAMSNETASVYMEIGLQVGILLIKDILENVGDLQDILLDLASNAKKVIDNDKCRK